MTQNFLNSQEQMRKFVIDALRVKNPGDNVDYDSLSNYDLQDLIEQNRTVRTPLSPKEFREMLEQDLQRSFNGTNSVSTNPITPIATNPTFPAYTRNQSASNTPILSPLFLPSTPISPSLGPYTNENIFSLSSLPASTSAPANLIPISNPSSPIFEEPKENTETSKGQAQNLLDKYKTTVFNSSASDNKVEFDNAKYTGGPVPITITDLNKPPTPGYISKTQESEPVNTYEAPSYVTKTQESEPVNTYEAPSYISKDASENPFDKAFGFISPSYIPRGKQTAAKTSSTIATDAPRYTARNRKTQETSGARTNPSYISKEYLKRASRY